MNRSRSSFFILSCLVVFPLLTGTLFAASKRAAAPEDDSLYKYLAVFSEVLGLVRQAYVDEPDVDALLAGALDGTTDALDPFSLYVPASEVDKYLEARAVGRRHSGLTLLKERGVAYVVAVDKGSPSAGADIKPGDIVASVDGRSTRLMPLWELQEILASKPGTKVEFELLRLGEPVQASLVLAPFDPPVPTLQEVDGAPVLRISSFEAKTAAAVREILDREAGKLGRGLLIDLRGVSSGDAEAAYETARLFTTGEMGALVRRSEPLEIFEGGEKPVWQGRTVVLVDRGTLGAAEVFATVLRQKEKAELVGEKTFGHAGRQATAELSTGGRLLFTEAFYTGPDQNPLNESLAPDVAVDERSRSFLDKDKPISELILQRGLDLLLGRKVEAAAAAA